LLETILPDATPATLADNPRTRSEYDAAGQKTAEIDVYGGRANYRYNASGRVIEVIDANGNISRSVYDGLDRAVAISSVSYTNV
jgi:YD repeat-containing protein